MGADKTPYSGEPFRRLSAEEIDRAKKGTAHVFGKQFRCKTDTKGYATPSNRSLLELVVDASEGFIPLWEKNTALRWRFQESSLASFADPEATKAAVRELLGQALLLWGSAVPVRFVEQGDLYDFEIVIREADDCDVNGCVLASAFFPDSGRHELKIYPRLFQESSNEQVETMAHELGHVFGLRHFFAQVKETAWPSEVFGTHNPFSIMNYGANSKMTDNDRADLKKLYELVWSGQLDQINGTPVKLVRPYHSS